MKKDSKCPNCINNTTFTSDSGGIILRLCIGEIDELEDGSVMYKE